jgi:CBS domain containing-hemolysin-like protein
VGESVVFEGRKLTVIEMDQRRISKVRVEPAEEEEGLQEEMEEGRE